MVPAVIQSQTWCLFLTIFLYSFHPAGWLIPQARSLLLLFFKLSYININLSFVYISGHNRFFAHILKIINKYISILLALPDLQIIADENGRIFFNRHFYQSAQLSLLKSFIFTSYRSPFSSLIHSNDDIRVFVFCSINS